MGKKGKNKIVDGLLPQEQSRPQLLGHTVRLLAELEKEREERNYYMLEREKIFQLWNILLEQIQIAKEKAALFNSHMQDVQKDKEAEDTLYNQKLRFLKQEQTRKLGQVRLHHLSKMKHVQDDAWAVQMVMREALMGKKKEIRQAQMAFFQVIRGLYWKHSKEVSDLRKDFAREIRRLESSFDRRLFETNDRKDEEQEAQVAKLANNKESQIHKLIESHRYQTKELQKFFRDLIRHNLTLIYGMKDAAKKQKTFELRARKDYEGFKAKYEKYVASAVKWKKDMESWEIDHENDFLEELLEELQAVNEESKHLRHTQRMMECSNETLKQRLIIAESERNALRKEFARSIVDVQKRTSMIRFVNQIKKSAAKRETEFYGALADNVEREKGDDVDYFLAFLSPRDREIKEIHQEITEYATEHKNIETNYKDIFKKNEINLADIGFPIKKTGAKARGEEDDILSETTDRMSRRHSVTLKAGRSKSGKSSHAKSQVAILGTSSRVSSNRDRVSSSGTSGTKRTSPSQSPATGRRRMD